MAEPAPVEIASIRKNTREEIRVSLTSYHGTEFVDVRVYADTGLPNRVPTPKGVAVKPDNVPALIEALQRAYGLLS